MARPFKIYSKQNCSFCVLAKQMIKDLVQGGDKDIDHYLLCIEDPPPDVVNRLKSETGHTTYPFIFFDGQFIGGYSELKAPKNLVSIINILEKKYGIKSDDDDI